MALNTIKPSISIIIPIYNGENWIDACFTAILKQTLLPFINLDIAICDDASTDKTSELLKKWEKKFLKLSISLKIFKNVTGSPKGVGYAKNRAIEISTGEYLCFQDIDDKMFPRRLEVQYRLAKDNHGAIIGGRFIRKPEDSTQRFARWANNLNDEQLQIQVYTSHGPTVIMPTWFCHKNVYYNVPGGFSERGHGTPEDLVFFYSHLDNNGNILRTDEIILDYYYHAAATTFSIKQKTIFEIRIAYLEKKVLCDWPTYTIWNAGKQGRRLFKSLSPKFQNRVLALCDVDIKKIGKEYTPHDSFQRKSMDPIPIIHFSKAQPPFIVCVKLDMTNGVFENNLKSLHLKEGLDYVLFS